MVVANGTKSRPLPPAQAGWRAVPPPASPAGLPPRRRWGRVAIGGMLALLGAWAGMILVATAGGRQERLALAHDVAKGETIERSDLRVVRVAADTGVATVPAGDLRRVIGKAAATDLPRGSLLARAQVLADGGRLVTTDEAVVGANLSPGAAPRGDVAPGTSILVVVDPPATGGEAGKAVEVTGWLRDIGDPAENTGVREASLVVPTSAAASVAAAAADDRVAVVTLGDTKR
jgi:SAF domain